MDYIYPYKDVCSPRKINFWVILSVLPLRIKNTWFMFIKHSALMTIAAGIFNLPHFVWAQGRRQFRHIKNFNLQGVTPVLNIGSYYTEIIRKWLFELTLFWSYQLSMLKSMIASVYNGTHAQQGKIFRISVLHTLAIGSAMPAHIRLELQKIFPCEAGEF